MGGSKAAKGLRLAIVLALPVVILLVDFWMYPAFLETRVENRDASLVALFAHRRVSLGMFHQHHVFASIDDIQDPAFLTYLVSKPSALVISAFANEGTDRDDFRFGELQRSVLAKLNTVSQPDSVALDDAFRTIPGFAEGQVLDQQLHIPADRYRSFPVDRILTVRLPTLHPDSTDLAKGFESAMAAAQQARVLNLIVPCLAIKWAPKQRHDLSLQDLFNAFFKSVPASLYPANIYLSLYEGWPTYQLEDAVLALNAAWRNSVDNLDFATSVYHSDFRMTILFLEVCLITCSFFISYSAKNAIIVITSFVGLALGAGKFVDFVPGDPGFKLLVKASILAGVAVGLPFITRWNPKDLFDK